MVTKGRFAELLGVDPSRVSQYIAEGKLEGCLVGEGRYAKVDVAKAMAALNQKMDISQRLGNGIGTKITVPTELGSLPLSGMDVPPLSPTNPTIEDQLKQQKLLEAERRNRRQAEEDALRRGTLVHAADARREINAVTTRMMQTFDGMISDMANDVSAKFSLPHRDLLHAMRQSFIAQRQRAADRARQDAEDAPARKEVVLEQEVALQ